MPVASPLRTWMAISVVMAMTGRRSGARRRAVPARSASQAADVLALVQLRRLLHRSLLDDRGEIVLALHLRLLLGLEDEIGAVDLVRLGVDGGRADEAVALEGFERLD